MKKQLLVSIAFLFSFLSHAQNGSNDLAKRNLKGKVKSVTENTFKGVEKFGEMEKGENTEWEYREFNPAGYQTRYERENIEKKWGKTTETFLFEDKTKLVEKREETKNSVSITRIQHNPQGRIGTVDFTDGNDMLKQRQKYRYSEAGLLTQIDAYNGDGSFYSKTVRTHNAKKQLVKQESYDETGKLTDVRTYAYDANGNLAEETDVDFWPKVTDTITRTYRYNEKKQKLEEGYHRSSTASDLFSDNFSTAFEYNDQGDVIQETWGFFEHKTVYTYDRRNNWIRSVKTSGPLLAGLQKDIVEIKERQIKYY